MSQMDRHEAPTPIIVGIVEESILLARGVRCVCDPCWTGRDRHDPHGCSWDDLTKLRELVDRLLAVSPAFAEGLPEWARQAPGPAPGNASTKGDGE